MTAAVDMGMLKHDIIPYLLLSWGLGVFGWILILSGVASLQQNCTSGPNGYAVNVRQLAGYLGIASCSQVYAYTWFIVWFAFFMLVLTPILALTGKLSKFRAGFIGLLAPAIMLLGDMSNTFIYYTDLDFNSTAVARARTITAGAVITSIGLYLVLICSGFVDEDKEKSEKSGQPTGAVYGGRYGVMPNENEPAGYFKNYTEKS